MIRKFVLAWPYYLVWRMWKWHRDYHEARHIGGEISQELVNAQNEEYEARMRLADLIGDTGVVQAIKARAWAEGASICGCDRVDGIIRRNPYLHEPMGDKP